MGHTERGGLVLTVPVRTTDWERTGLVGAVEQRRPCFEQRELADLRFLVKRSGQGVPWDTQREEG